TGTIGPSTLNIEVTHSGEGVGVRWRLWDGSKSVLRQLTASLLEDGWVKFTIEIPRSSRAFADGLPASWPRADILDRATKGAGERRQPGFAQRRSGFRAKQKGIRGRDAGGLEMVRL